MSLVSFVKIQGAEIDSIKKGIQESLDLINCSLPKESKNIVIKPNMCYYWDYSTGHTTDPKFVAALIEVIRDRISRSANISIVESDASAMKCKYAFPLLGYKELSREYGVDLVNLSEDKTENIQIEVNSHEFDLPLPQTIRDADLRINIPKIKYMDSVRISSALKNIFGCNPIPLKYKFHPLLCETIVALNKIMKFNLNILDGIILLGTHPSRLNLIMTSQDPVAFDVAASKLLGQNPSKVRTITLAQEEGLGNMNYVPKGIDPVIFEKVFPKKSISDKFVTSGYAFGLRTGLFKR